MKIQAVGGTDVGCVRDHNEDFFHIDAKLGLHVVCDGMGGHAAGEVASETASAAIHHFVSERADQIRNFDGSETHCQQIAEILNQAVIHASKTVYEVAAGDKGKHGMGTTCVALLTVGGKGIMANVGDSRLYLARDGQLYQLSTDHNFATEAVAQGMMTAEQAVNSPHGNVLTRAVGTQPSVTCDILIFDVLVGDTYLLCSDGLHEYARDPEELCAMLSVAAIDSIPSHLIKLARDGGGHDNITGVVLRSEKQAPEEQRARKQSVTRSFEALRELELFQALSMAELMQVYNRFEQLEFQADADVIREGDASEHLYVLVEGEVEVSREGKAIATLQSGMHFGEMALLNQRPRSASVKATVPTRLLSMPRAQFQDLMAKDPVVATKFLWKFAQSLSLRLDDAYLARDIRKGRDTMGLAEMPAPGGGE